MSVGTIGSAVGSQVPDSRTLTLQMPSLAWFLQTMLIESVALSSTGLERVMSLPLGLGF
jgi:hypothetical protein